MNFLLNSVANLIFSFVNWRAELELLSNILVDCENKIKEVEKMVLELLRPVVDQDAPLFSRFESPWIGPFAKVNPADAAAINVKL